MSETTADQNRLNAPTAEQSPEQAPDATPDHDQLAQPDETAPDTTDDGVEEEAPAEGKPGNAEAAKYRRRLRDTEAQRDTIREERDALTAKLAAIQRQQAETLVSDHLAQPGDLFAFGTTLEDVLDDEGRVSPDKTLALTEQLLNQRPGLRKAPAWPDTGQGHRQSVTPPPGADWQTAIRTARR